MRQCCESASIYRYAIVESLVGNHHQPHTTTHWHGMAWHWCTIFPLLFNLFNVLYTYLLIFFIFFYFLLLLLLLFFYEIRRNRIKSSIKLNRYSHHLIFSSSSCIFSFYQSYVYPGQQHSISISGIVYQHRNGNSIYIIRSIEWSE